jgi:hypothetical protein
MKYTYIALLITLSSVGIAIASIDTEKPTKEPYLYHPSDTKPHTAYLLSEEVDYENHERQWFDANRGEAEDLEGVYDVPHYSPYSAAQQEAQNNDQYGWGSGMTPSGVFTDVGAL